MDYLIAKGSIVNGRVFRPAKGRTSLPPGTTASGMKLENMALRVNEKPGFCNARQVIK
jgi:hypothetical protein